MSTDSNNDVKDWWAENPMTYGHDQHGSTTYQENGQEINVELGSKEFFEHADKTFLEWNSPLHLTRPFEKIFPFDEFKNKKVLEIGCGMGLMSSLWAKAGAEVTAVDLNPVAIEQTKNRFKTFDLKGQIQQEDGNRLSLDSNSFDYVYSWGVLHHSPNLELSISEMMRVLKPGGKFGIMLYNRHSLLYWYHCWLIEGWLHRESKFLHPLQLGSRYGDGAKEEGNPHTWPVTRRELRDLFSPYLSEYQDRLLGTDLESVLLHMIPGLAFVLPKFVKKSWGRRFGWSIWANGIKRS